MRFGRILLALIAPLVSLPALASEGAHDRLQKSPAHPLAVDSLLNLLRSVVPSVAPASESGSHRTAPPPHAAGPASRPFLAPALAPQLSPAAEANLHLLERQHLRALLRC
jgi:hypothetical protein